MKKLNLVFILFIASGLMNLFSQKTNKTEKISVTDFLFKADKSAYLIYRSLFTFPYMENYNEAGALDKFFGLKNETFIRVFLNGNDTSLKFFAVPAFYKSKPELTSVTCYYLNRKKISLRKIKEPLPDLFISSDQGYFIDLYSFKNEDTNVIIDLNYTYSIDSKKEINVYIDNRMDYKFITIRLEVPEIYTYKVLYDKKCLSEEISKPYSGSTIGYSLSGGRLISKQKNEYD